MRLASLEDIQSAQRMNRWLDRPDVDTIELGINLDPGDKSKIQSRLENLYNDCGCFWAPPAFLVSFIAIFVPNVLAFHMTWQLVWISFLTSFIVAFVAKIFALLVSHLRLTFELRKLAEKISSPQSTAIQQ